MTTPILKLVTRPDLDRESIDKIIAHLVDLHATKKLQKLAFITVEEGDVFSEVTNNLTMGELAMMIAYLQRRLWARMEGK